jgi:hypothetical protein
MPVEKLSQPNERVFFSIPVCIRVEAALSMWR